MDFSQIWASFWEGLGGVWGAIWPSKTGPKRAKLTFSIKFRFFKDLGKVLGGFGDGFGRVLVRSGSLLGIPLWMHPCWALLGFAGLCLAWFGFAGLCWALLGFAGLCWSLLVFAGLCWASLGLARLCWAWLGLQCFAELCRALLSFAGLC